MDTMDTTDPSKSLEERLARIHAMEAALLEREAALKAKEQTKKQIILRLAPTLWDQIAAWSQDDFRSINGQIEYILSEAVKTRGRAKRAR